MQYDFETILDRRGRDALALDVIPYAGVEPKAGFSRKARTSWHTSWKMRFSFCLTSAESTALS